ncbi:MAG: sensor histidine kinase [Halobacteriota archaeon]
MEPPEEWVAVPVGVVITLAGLTFAVFILYSHRVTGGLLSIDLRLIFLLVAALGTGLGGIWLLVARPANRHVLRVLVWWCGAMALTLSMAVMLLHQQAQRGVSVANPVAVRVNSLFVGSVGGLLIAYFYTNARQNAEALAVERTQLQREKERLEVLQRMISHDIRNDMNVVLGWSDHLKETVTAEQRQIVDRIHSGSKHAVELTDLSRDYVAMIVDDDSMELKPTALAEVLTMEIKTCRDVYPVAEFSVSTELPSVDVTANELLHSVFRNILNNAVQHNDTARPAVEVAVTEQEDIVRVAVADNGPGVPDERKDVLFGKGEIGMESEGTGVGLYLVNVLVDEYGGSVWFEDNDPAGSIVVVELKRALKAPSAPTQTPEVVAERT